MSETTKAVDREETFDKLVAVRVRSELVDRVETLSQETISEELRNGLRARRLELEEEHDQLVTDGGRDEPRVHVTPAEERYQLVDVVADLCNDAMEFGDVSREEALSALAEVAEELDREVPALDRFEEDGRSRDGGGGSRPVPPGVGSPEEESEIFEGVVTGSEARRAVLEGDVVYVHDHESDSAIAAGFDSLDDARAWIDASDREEISRTSEPEERSGVEPVDGREL